MNALACALFVLGAIGLLGMIAVFLTARHNDKLDGPAPW